MSKGSPIKLVVPIVASIMEKGVEVSVDFFNELHEYSAKIEAIMSILSIQLFSWVKNTFYRLTSALTICKMLCIFVL